MSSSSCSPNSFIDHPITVPQHPTLQRAENGPLVLDRQLEYENVRTTTTTTATRPFAPIEVTAIENFHEEEDEDMSSLSFHPEDVDEAVLINFSDTDKNAIEDALAGSLRVEDESAASGVENSPASRSKSRYQPEMPHQCTNDLPHLVEDVMDRCRNLAAAESEIQGRLDDTSGTVVAAAQHAPDLVGQESKSTERAGGGTEQREAGVVSESSANGNNESETMKQKGFPLKFWIFSSLLGWILLLSASPFGFYSTQFSGDDQKTLAASSFSEEMLLHPGEIQGEIHRNHLVDDKHDHDSSTTGRAEFIIPSRQDPDLAIIPFALVHNNNSLDEVFSQVCCFRQDDTRLIPFWKTTMIFQQQPGTLSESHVVPVVVGSHSSDREGTWIIYILSLLLGRCYMLVLSASLVTLGAAGLAHYVFTFGSKKAPSSSGAHASFLPQQQPVVPLEYELRAAENAEWKCSQQRVECKCRCCTTLTKFDNLVEFHKTFKPSGMGRRTCSPIPKKSVVANKELPEKYNKLTMTELKHLIVALDPNLAGPKELYGSSKPVLVAKVYHSYARVLESFTRLQLFELLQAKGFQHPKKGAARKNELVEAALAMGF